jgi:hypothetical protein
MTAALSMELARALAQRLAAEMGATIVDKDTDPISLGVAALLDAANKALVSLGLPVPDALMSGAQYLTGWATTYGKRVTMPRCDTGAQYIELACHELGHVDHFVTSGPPVDPYAMPGGAAYMVGYVLGDVRDLATHDEIRARAEAQCECGRLEAHHLLTGEIPTLADAQAPLCSAVYLLGDNGKGIVRDLTRARLVSIKAGVYLAKPARALRKILVAEYPQLVVGHAS